MAAVVAAACGVEGRCSGLKIEAAGRLGLRLDAGRRALLWCAAVVLMLLLLPAVTGRYGAETTGRGSRETRPGLENRKFIRCQYEVNYCPTRIYPSSSVPELDPLISYSIASRREPK